ncbi:phosphatase PAP2 family protein [Emticicia sp. TH156]|uniref:phosphatase PAP2 family protein n=1 Tax=Emticicia sp. TH156 TaxID=2067454 RepID=UPI000C787DF1|nr:phosphatase PAP2 family protein [Emticicia sp. TH156]PLK45727.1 PA-phosphatase [Emticicia sp. TH156]
MKKIHVSFLVIVILSLVVSSCNKDLEESLKEAYIPAKLDEKGGTWKTYVLASADEFPVAEPKAAGSAEYQAEIAKLKTTVSTITPENKKAVAYWGAGAVYRWNEIARELAARYNLPPASNAEGKYPVPDAANPLADPKFPFANPPYTARALAYLSVAQYDALVAAWNYKFKYNRKAPSKTDATVSALLPVSDLPSYPSEDAVVAAASYTILVAMFPGEVPLLDAKLAEAKNARIWGGMNVDSDISAGDALGKAVAAKVMGRAKTDGMGAANNQTVNAAAIANAKAQGLKSEWLSQEIPARPPMLPNYGTVQTWNFDKAAMLAMRPSPPPALDSDEFKKDLDELKAIDKNQTREQARIANYWSDGAGSYTPPGHWHRAAANLCFQNKFSELATARTLALLGTAEMDAGIACWDAKNYYYYPRPQQFGIKTSVGLPNFQSYTSGHSTFSGAAATVLGSIFPTEAEKLNAMAQEASNSRVYGLIHYRFDCVKGLEHGKKIGQYAIARGKADGSGL